VIGRTARVGQQTIGLVMAFGSGVLISAVAFDLTEEAFWEAGSARAIVAGALLEGIPESVAIGISLVGGGGPGLAVVAAVFLSNLPESLSATTGLRKASHPAGWILGLTSTAVRPSAWSPSSASPARSC
jgi:zinc transporter, ZIP family